jgi:hypothetical protein
MEATVVSTEEVTSDDRVSTLRGAGVQTVDRRRMLWLGLVALIVGLVAASIVLFVAGAKKNAQIDDLKRNGVPVEVTITGCQGLLGGSGSNAAGYDCRGTFTLNGRHIDAAIPGSSLLSPGTKIQVVASPGDPGLVSTSAVLSGEHASDSVYLLPSVLAALALISLGIVVALYARGRRRGDPAADG